MAALSRRSQEAKKLKTTLSARPPIRAAAAQRIIAFTALLCALGALLVSGVTTGLFSPVVWNSVFGAVTAFGYISLFLSASRGAGRTVRAEVFTRCIAVLTVAALVGVTAALMSAVLGSWIPLAIASLVVGAIAAVSTKLF